MLKKLLTGLALLAPLLFANSAHAKRHDVRVEQVSFPVVLSDGVTYNIAGFYYHRDTVRAMVGPYRSPFTV